MRKAKQDKPPKRSLNIKEDQQIIHTLHPPAIHDDFFVPIEAPAPLLLIETLVAAAHIVNKIAQQNAIKLQLAAGNTEAVIQLRGKGKNAAMLTIAEHRPS